MNTEDSGILGPESGAPSATLDPDGRSLAPMLPHRRRFTPWRLLVGGARWFLGALCSTWALLSVLGIGWSGRAARRETLRTWWRVSPVRARGITFESFAAADPATADCAGWPSWFAGTPDAIPAASGRWRRGVHRAFGGLAQNARLGVGLLLNTWVLTLPPCLLWAVAWFAGWQNSFNKGYEHAWFGPTVFVLGMLWFSAAMAHVPLAQARQASTGDWRRFYDFRLLWRLIRRQWLASVVLALVWAGACGLVLLIKLAPQLAQYVPGLLELPASEQWRVSRNVYFAGALVLFPAFLLTRLLAARLYAQALRRAYQCGAILEDDLGEWEWQALRRLELLTPSAAPERRWWLRLAAWLATRTGQLTAAAAVFLVWFALSFLVVVSEFIARTDHSRGWWNQPMIQLTWFDYTPDALHERRHPEPEAARSR
ncbi:MAG: hypothetical protein J0L84_17960 [Verrucomicrobia bacterium]|nr:hypothetical protein [Verrucomicrobiota bacterium]